MPTFVVLLYVVYCVAVMGTQELYTEDSTQYKFFPYSHKSIHFKVKAGNDVHVGLTTGPQESDPMIEIAIGGWSNTNSVLRRRFRTIPEKVSAETPGILSAGEYRGFWVSWEDGLISVGREDADAPFLSWKDPEPFHISYVGVHTGFGSKGSWLIGDPPATRVTTPAPASTPRDVDSCCKCCYGGEPLPLTSVPAFTNAVTPKSTAKRLTTKSTSHEHTTVTPRGTTKSLSIKEVNEPSKDLLPPKTEK